MNIFFLNYDGYSGCSGVHIHFLANALADRGHTCTVILPYPNEKNDYFGPVRYNFLTFDETLALAQMRPAFFKQAVFHAWTPREVLRPITLFLAEHFKRPYFVHLEDNERYILEKAYNAPFEKLEEAARNGRIEPAPQFSHPLHHQEFLANAAGVTCIIDALKRFVPENVPTEVFWPACEDAFFRLSPKPNMAVRAQLGIAPDEWVVTYPGNFHFANCHVMQELYLALDILAASGHPVRLIRAGGEYGDISTEAKAAFIRHGIHVGMVPATELPALVGAANLLVQPGAPGDFDDCRFPSKLPFFLASGRPLVTAATNLGKLLKHGENCLILPDSSAQSIAASLITLIENPSLAAQIGQAGRQFAQQAFNWDNSAKRVERFYKKVLGEE